MILSVLAVDLFEIELKVENSTTVLAFLQAQTDLVVLLAGLVEAVDQIVHWLVVEELNSLLSGVGGETGFGLKFGLLVDLFQPN